MDQTILAKYKSLENSYKLLVAKKKNDLRLISLARFICFILVFVVYFSFYKTFGNFAFIFSFLFVALFLYLVKKYIYVEKQLVRFQHLEQINSNEIQALNHNFSVFDPGLEYINHNHDYSFDIDLYGEGSLFQYINRTGTKDGSVFLSTMLNNSKNSKKHIEKLQESIEELAEDINWRQTFYAIGLESKQNIGSKNINRIIQHKVILKSEKLIKYTTKILPALTIIMISLAFLDYVNNIYIIPVLAQWVLFAVYSKTISKFQKQFESVSKILNSYAEFLFLIENKNFKSSYLIELKLKLNNLDSSASTITKEIKHILSEFDYRQNIIVGFILNSVLLWDIRCLLKMLKWQKKHSEKLPVWISVIAEIDALNSFANLNYNHPNWYIPSVTEPKFHLSAQELGHPLINETKCVTNSIEIIEEEQITIITGANMAGKSTFLRAVGVNLILAANGCRVYASRFEFSPLRLYTNMRTSDNLMNDESYFYAELLRLQAMLNLIKSGESTFVIIDEMLKGTNSTDKLNGSIELIKQLINLKTHGIVATHDLNLTEMINLFPGIIKNECFEVMLKNDELIFDYKLSPGVTQTMNATYLMKKMGIIPSNN